MDLALALGRDVGSMPEREFSRWGTYARRKVLPFRRIEFMLAQLTAMVASTAGVQNAKASDYLFDPERDESGAMLDPPDPTQIAIDAALKAFM